MTSSNRCVITLGSYIENMTTKIMKLEIDLNTISTNNPNNFDKLLFNSSGDLITDENEINNFKCLSIIFSVYNTRRKGIVFSSPADLNDLISNQYREHFEQSDLGNLYRAFIEIGKRFHLNQHHAGTPKQEFILYQEINKSNVLLNDTKIKVDYEPACEILKKHNMLIDPDCNYEYGSGWVGHEIPKQTLDFVEKVMDIMKSYDLVRLKELNDELSNDSINHLFSFSQDCLFQQQTNEKLQQHKLNYS